MPNTFALGRIFEDMWARMKEHGNWKEAYANRKGGMAAHLLAAHACPLEHV